MIYQEHAHRKLRQAFDAILQQFSSNDNRKLMLSANRNFQAQNSTCSTLLQIILLYETYIVELKIFVRCQNKEMALMAPSDGDYIDGNYIDSYSHLLVNSGFIFTYLIQFEHFLENLHLFLEFFIYVNYKNIIRFLRFFVNIISDEML